MSATVKKPGQANDRTAGGDVPFFGMSAIRHRGAPDGRDFHFLRDGEQ
jgi:hypothetical protein